MRENCEIGRGGGKLSPLTMLVLVARPRRRDPTARLAGQHLDEPPVTWSSG